jgi:MFS family permease
MGPRGGEGFRAVFAHPGFRALFGSSLTSSIGATTSAIAVNWLVFHETHSTLDIAYLGLVGILPGIVLGLLAGVLADRYNRRHLMVACDLVRMSTIAILAAALLLTGFSLLLVLAAMALVYSFSALFTPASQAILPRLVAGRTLEEANGALAAFQQVGGSAGAALGGVIVSTVGAVAGLGVNAATYAVSAVFLLHVASSFGVAPARAGGRRSMGNDLREGLRYMRTHRPILEVTLGFLPVNFLLIIVTGFLVVYASDRFGSDPLVYGYLAASLAAGAAVGALGIARWKVRGRVGWLYGLSVVIDGGAVALLALSTNVGLSIVAAVVSGVLLGMVNTAFFSTMQSIVPNEVLARVLSIDSVGSFVGIPAGYLVGGVLANDYGIGETYWIVAGALLANGAAMLLLPDIRHMGYGRSAG